MEDPFSRDSRDSLLLQIADLTAYVAFRRILPPPARPTNVVTADTWAELGVARWCPAYAPDGIVRLPE